MKNQVVKNLILLLSTFILLFSCGKASKGKSYFQQEQEEISDGVYAAVLYPVNLSIDKDLQGGIKIHKFGDDFKVKVKIKGAPKGTQEQYLYSGSECPTLYNDLNGDGIIDGNESRAVMGEVILPFDGDLSSVEGGGGLFPVDSYEYSQSTSYSLMLSDLQHSYSNRFLKLEKSAVLIIKEGTHPLACGVLTKISDLPEIEKPPAPQSERDRYRPRPPRPKPPPPPPTVEPPPETREESWWDQWRNTWRRWRESLRDWWRSLG